MPNLRKKAELHRAKFLQYVDDVGVDVEVRQPQAKTDSTNDVDKVFGPRARETTPGTSATVKAVFVHRGSTSNLAYGRAPELGPLGKKIYDADRILKVVLTDALVDADVPAGKTIFDTAFDVVIEGIRYDVIGTDRTGLPSIAPYVLWVGLKTLGEVA